jgi:SAM-dependent methyltransferase
VATVRFGEVAASYDKGRPGYPEALVDDVLALCDISDDARVLEVGAGTGKLTELLARRDLDVLAIEPSAEMAAVARRKLAAYPRVSIAVATFEDWPAEPNAFALLVSAQAWHWVALEARYPKAHQVLRPSGGLALFWSHPRWDECALGRALASVYAAIAPELYGDGPWFPGFTGPHGAERPSQTELSGYFGSLTERSYRWALDYTVDQYLELLRSFPEHLRVPVGRRDALFNAVGKVIESSGAPLRMNYETRLYFASRST